VRIARHLAVIGPLLVAGALFLPRALPVPRPGRPHLATPTHLPAMHGSPAARGARGFELDADASSVRFLVQHGANEQWAICTGASGSLRLGVAGNDGDLEIRLPLAAVRTLPGDGAPLDLPQLLGVHRADEIVLRVALVARTETDLAGVTSCHWLGTLGFGSQVRRQPLLTWMCALPGKPLRLQGHGTVPASDYGLPRRGLFSFLDAPHDITLGLDLAFRRRRSD
jgi:hypothetical protein